MSVAISGAATSPPAPGAPGGLALLAALRQPAAYPHPTGTIRLHETHLSWIVVAGDYACKLKKPVDLGFADFSTVARRAAACAEEVRLNRRLCPDLYLGVVDIVERGGAIRVGGPGRPLEPAVRMRRLPDAGMLPALLARHAVEPRLLRRIAAQLVQFHATAATGPGVDRWGTPEAVRANWAEHFAQTATLDPAILPPALTTDVRAAVGRALDRDAPLLAQRVGAGRVCDGHGDLHAGNICVEGRRIHLFDCLEFSPRYRCADVAAEVAFLAMDLTARGRADLAERFVADYTSLSGDRALPALLPPFVAYRAWTRGKVLALRLAEPDLPADERADLAAMARRYFTLAWATLGGVARPTLVVTLGLPASGKTRLARELAGHLGLVHLSSDIL
jgi:aminoglycoside phosphotransferase family enzyme